MPTVRLQTIVVQNDLSVNSKLSSFAEDSCHQPFGAKWFVFPETAAPTPTAWLSGSLVFENWETNFDKLADFVESVIEGYLRWDLEPVRAYRTTFQLLVVMLDGSSSHPLSTKASIVDVRQHSLSARKKLRDTAAQPLNEPFAQFAESVVARPSAFGRVPAAELHRACHLYRRLLCLPRDEAEYRLHGRRFRPMASRMAFEMYRFPVWTRADRC